MAGKGRPKLPVIIDDIEGSLYVVDGPSTAIGRVVVWRTNEVTAANGADLNEREDAIAVFDGGTLTDDVYETDANDEDLDDYTEDYDDRYDADNTEAA